MAVEHLVTVTATSARAICHLRERHHAGCYDVRVCLCWLEVIGATPEHWTIARLGHNSRVPAEVVALVVRIPRAGQGVRGANRMMDVAAFIKPYFLSLWTMKAARPLLWLSAHFALFNARF